MVLLEMCEGFLEIVAKRMQENRDGAEKPMEKAEGKR